MLPVGAGPHRPAGGLCGLSEDRCDLMVGEPGHDSGDAYACGDAPVRESCDRLESSLGRGGSRLHRPPHDLLKRGHRECDAHAVVGGEFSQKVEVADRRALHPAPLGPQGG